MTWTLTASLEEYLSAARDFLVSDRVRRTIELTVAEGLRAASASSSDRADLPLFGWWQPIGGRVTAALLHTPPYPVLLTGLPADSGAELAQLLAGAGRQLAGVHSELGPATRFAAAWRELTGCGYEAHRSSRLYRLGRLVQPEPMPDGEARVGGAQDLDLLESWHSTFATETNGLAGEVLGLVADRLSFGGLALWEIAGQPKAMAGANRPAAGVVRIGPVYTPRELRGHGYGSAITFSVSQTALQSGASELVLFTDLANPTSNALYRRLGYEPVEDRVVFRFRASC